MGGGGGGGNCTDRCLQGTNERGKGSVTVTGAHCWQGSSSSCGTGWEGVG